MAKICETFQTRRRRRVGVLLQSENWIQKSRTSIRKKKEETKKTLLDNFVNNIIEADEWRKNFRISKANFIQFYDKARPFLQKQSTIMRSSMNVKKQVALTLYHLSDDGRNLKVANALEIGKSTVF